MSKLQSQQQQQPPAAVMQQYRELMAERQKLVGKISELETDRNEHLLVEETLKPLDPHRRAYRLVGECLVERTVEEVLPSVAANRENVRTGLN
jgi:prefoldin subunit 2